MGTEDLVAAQEAVDGLIQYVDAAARVRQVKRREVEQPPPRALPDHARSRDNRLYLEPHALQTSSGADSVAVSLHNALQTDYIQHAAYV